MNRSITLFTFSILSITPHITKGMIHPRQFNEIEKQIFLKEVNRIGKEAALQQIQNTKDPERIDDGLRCAIRFYPCFIITSQFRPSSHDSLTTLVMQTIADQEKKNGYIPEHIKKSNHLGISITMPNNFLGKYSRYYHKKDQNGTYIELKSTFDDKQSLLNILENQQ